MAYPTKLRERALQAVRNGHPKVEASEMFGLGENTLRDWENLEAETGSLEKRPLAAPLIKLTVKSFFNDTAKTHAARTKRRPRPFMAVYLEFAAQRNFWELRVKNTLEYAKRNEQKRE